MKFWVTSKHWRKSTRVVAGLMLVLWVGAFAVTAVPRLHWLLHKDAQSLNHHCLITQLQQQSLLAGGMAILAPAAPVNELSEISPTDSSFVPAQDYRLSPSRAPPVSSSLATVVG